MATTTKPAPVLSTKQQFLDVYKKEHATTLKVLRAFPADKAAFKPHDRSNSALQLAWMAGGVVVVESVFQYPGIGAALVDAVGNRDIVVVQTVTMLAAAIYVFLNLAADLATIMVTPRLRTAGR